MPTFSSNGTNFTNCSKSCGQDSARVSKAVAMFGFGGFGILGNIFVILLAVRYTVRKNLHHLIINMAVSDILFVAAKIVLFTNHGFVNIWSELPSVLSLWFCKMTLFFAFVSILVSATSLLIVSIERFRATRLTMQISTPYTIKQRLGMLAYTWVICIALASFTLLHGEVENDLHRYTCSLRKVHWIWLVAYFVAPFLSLFGNVGLSILTLQTLRKSCAIHDSIPEPQRHVREKRTSRIVQMVLCSVFLYSCCYLPSFIHKLLAMIDTSLDKLKCPFDFIVHSFLPTANSCCSPWIYVVFLSDFFEAAKKVLSSVCQRFVRRKVNQQPDQEMVGVCRGIDRATQPSEPSVIQINRLA